MILFKHKVHDVHKDWLSDDYDSLFKTFTKDGQKEFIMLCHSLNLGDPGVLCG